MRYLYIKLCLVISLFLILRHYIRQPHEKEILCIQQVLKYSNFSCYNMVAGSIPDVVFFNRPNPSRRIMTLGSTQPLTEMSTRKFRGGKGAACA
jgi:hypothetical protein